MKYEEHHRDTKTCHQAPEKCSCATLVELGTIWAYSTLQLLGGSHKAAVVVLATKDGLRLTIRFEDGGRLDVAGLLAAFCGWVSASDNISILRVPN